MRVRSMGWTAIAVAVGLHRRRRRNELGLQRGERVVALSQQWLDPIIVLVIVGATLRQELTDPAHVGLAVAGVLIGGVAGYVRGRLLFLEARPDIGRVVLRRGVAEIAIVAGLLVLTYAARHFPTTFVRRSTCSPPWPSPSASRSR